MTVVTKYPPQFILILHPTYRRTGFFNITVANDRHFGPHNSIINVYVGNNPIPIIGRVDRTANTNRTARIMGGTELRDWFNNTQVMQQITVTVLNHNSINLSIGGNAGVPGTGEEKLEGEIK
jgi:hypothetical protein